MPFAAGARLGPYEVISPLGAGGMGEVYRAKDTRLDREVAVKVLSEHLSASDELRSRFEREAKAISSLAHPHICTLFDVGREGETDYLVMELLEGESLSDRLEKGPLPLEQVLKLGIQIADALEKAHGSGIVHRDLKPGNVFVTERGVKLLDFGLAKLHAAATQTSATQMGVLPTEQLSAPLTSAGMILGTFQYMSPEQLEGKESDARSDLFALGCVLYEMATGKKAFSGSSQASLIGSIMHSSPPPVSSLTALSPPALDRVIATCLEKDPKNRWHTAHDVKLQLQWIAEGGSQVGLPAPVVAHRKNRERLAWALAALATVAAAAVTAGYLRRAPAPPRVARFEMPQPAKLINVGEPKLSPDGKHVAFAGIDDKGAALIWLRSFDSLEARPLAGTEGTSTRSRPFWSPDSQFVAFMAEGKLKKIPIAGGPAQKICDAPTGADGTWSERGLILFDGQPNDPILACEAAGGVAKPLVTRVEGADGYQVAWPQFLPGGQKFLYVTFAGKEEANGIRLANADGSDAHLVVGGLSRVEYAPPGHLVFVKETTLVAQRFDAASGKLSGEPIPIVDGIGVDANGQAEFSVSREGVLVYRAGRGAGVQLTWVDRRGARAGEPVDSGDLYNPALSRDGRWLVVQRTESKGDDLWLRDLRRGVSSRLTFAAGDDWTPLFSADGQSVLYSRDDGNNGRTVVLRALDSATERELYASKDGVFPVALSADGRELLMAVRETAGNSWDLHRLSLAGGGTAVPYVTSSEFLEFRATFSPDGRWVAYQSNESGRNEIYVLSYPSPGRKWQISTDGGIEPAWSPGGKELYYVSGDRRLMRVEVSTGASFDAGVPEPMFAIGLAAQTARNRYVVAPDGERFLVVAPAGEGLSTPMTAVIGWDAALAR
jgi:eukaryotic-like serine/threonine-protein kinase